MPIFQFRIFPNLCRTLGAMLLAWSPVFAADATVFFVNPLGKDTWSGNTGTPNKGGNDGPFATVKRAQEAVRATLASRPGPVDIRVAAGRYPLTEALVFTEADGGRPGASVRWIGAGPEETRFSGGRLIKSEWKQAPGKPYFQATIPEAKAGQWFFSSLYVNGRSLTPARTPNENQVMFRGVSQAPGEASNRAFVYSPGDMDPKWTNPEDITLVLLCSWTPTLHTGLTFDADRRVVKFESSHWRPVDFFEKRFRYYVSHVFEALDAPGEWYLDRRTGTLYIVPESGMDLNAAEIIAPGVVTRLLTVEPTVKGAPIRNLEFHGIAFEHTEGDQAKHNGVYRQGHMFLGAGVYAKYLRNGVFSNCAFAHLGEYAMELAEGCQQNRVEQCHFYDIGAGGIQVGISDLGTLKTLEKSAPASEVRVLSNLIQNNLVHRLGTRWHGCYGILNRFASFSRILHNELFDLHWDAIASDARWDYKGEDYSMGHEIAWNRMHWLGLGYHGDAAGYYQFGPLDTWVHHNIVYHTEAYEGIHAGFSGIYLDEMSRGALVENNLVHRTAWDAYHQNWGSNNVFRNNIGAFAKDGFITRGGFSRNVRNDFTAAGNIYLASNEVVREQKFVHGPVPTVLERNLYWTLTPGGKPDFYGKTLEEIQGEGDEAGSLVGNPGFKDPLRGDFRLDPANPLLAKIGFVPFQDAWARVGLYGEAPWIALPYLFTARARLPVESAADLAKNARLKMDFEDLPVGTRGFPFTLREEGEATMVVDGAFAAGGKRSLKIVDRARGVKSYNPHLFQTFKPTDGKIRVAFDFRLDPDGPIALTLEGRGKGGADEVGPRVEIKTDGAVVVDNQTLGEIPPGKWGHLEVRFEPRNAGGTYEVTLRGEGTEAVKNVPWVRRSFKALTWLGIMAPLSVDGQAWIDNLFMGLE